MKTKLMGLSLRFRTLAAKTLMDLIRAIGLKLRPFWGIREKNQKKKYEKGKQRGELDFGLS